MVSDNKFEEAGTIVLEDDEGNEHAFEVLGVIDSEENVYAILVPDGALDDEDDDTLEVLVLRVESGDDDDDSVQFSIVDDEAEFQDVIEAWELIEKEEDEQE